MDGVSAPRAAAPVHGSPCKGNSFEGKNIIRAYNLPIDTNTTVLQALWSANPLVAACASDNALKTKRTPARITPTYLIYHTFKKSQVKFKNALFEAYPNNQPESTPVLARASNRTLYNTTPFSKMQTKIEKTVWR